MAIATASYPPDGPMNKWNKKFDQSQDIDLNDKAYNNIDQL